MTANNLPRPGGPVLPPMGEWVERAACVGVNPALFDPPGAGPISFARYRVAAYFCGSCPVARECDEVGTTSGHVGVWGGKLRSGPKHAVDLVANLQDIGYFRRLQERRLERDGDAA